MRNIWLLFIAELKSLFANVVSVAIIAGLVIVPSIFAWYNVLACWDVFDNTGNLKVAVANTDEGYQSDLVPLRINVGDRVVSALRENDQIDWVFTDADDAVDGARAGRYYAAVVIPQSFSRDMLTFYSEDMEHAQIIYYANEKKSAIAPKITDQGADTVSAQINQVFAETLSEVTLGLAGSLSTYADESDASGRIGAVADHLDAAAAQMGRIGSAVALYAPILETAQGLVTDSVGLMDEARNQVAALEPGLGDSVTATKGIADSLSAGADGLAGAFDASAASLGAVSDATDRLFDQAGADSQRIAAALRSQASSLDGQVTALRTLAEQLEALGGQADLPEQAQSALSVAVARLQASAQLVEDLQASMNASADRLEQGQAQAAQEREAVKAKAEQARQALTDLRTDYETNLQQPLQDLADKAKAMAAQAESGAAGLASAAGRLGSDTDSAIAALDGGADGIRQAADKLRGVGSALQGLAAEVRDALARGDGESLRSILGSDVQALSQALAAPVGIKRVALYPAANFGSAMAPLYTTLAIFIGALLIMVVIKPKPSRKAEALLKNPKPRQLFLGHFGICALISLAQTTVMGAGNLWLLKVQVCEPVLFMLCYWFAGLVFTFIIYALVVSFANLGKAIAVLMLIVQVTGCGGSFPLQIMPDFVQLLSPWLPATHAVNAMRAAMMGLYGNDYWVQMGELALFLVPAALLGLVLRKPLARFMEWYVEKVESSKLIA